MEESSLPGYVLGHVQGDLRRERMEDGGHLGGGGAEGLGRQPVFPGGLARREPPDGGGKLANGWHCNEALVRGEAGCRE
eukprot:14312956-Alexandrium_andersonii.AAC.1